MTELSSAERHRYSRHLILPEVGLSGQKKLKSSSVLCVGAGGLGSPLALYLAAAGIGKIGIIDFDLVDETNLQRQILHGTSTIGQSKLESAKARLKDLNPHVEVECISERLEANNAIELFKKYDIVADGTDNFPTRYLVNDACVLTGTPNVYGSIFQFEGQISVFHYENGPCYRCVYAEPPPPGLVPSCAEGGVLGVLPGIVGCLQANEVIKIICEMGEVASGRLIMIDALGLKFRELKIRKDPNCAICSNKPTITEPIDYELFCGIPQATEAEAPVPSISVKELDKIIKQQKDETRVIDVREPVEVDICQIPSTEKVPLNTLSQAAKDWDKKTTYYIHCKLGGRSAKAVRELQSMGFKNVFNVDGGISAWIQKVDPSLTDY